MHDPFRLLWMPNACVTHSYIDLCLFLPRSFISLSLGPIAMSNCKAGKRCPALLSSLDLFVGRGDAASAICELRVRVGYR